MRDRMEMLRGTTPRILELVKADTKGQPLLGQRRISEGEAIRRIDPLMGLFASGVVPIDETTAPLVSRALERVWAEAEKED